VRDVFENRITPQLNDHTSEQAFSGSEEGRISISRAGFATAGLNLTGGLDPMEVDLAGFVDTAPLFIEEANNNGGVHYLKLMQTIMFII